MNLRDPCSLYDWEIPVNSTISRSILMLRFWVIPFSCRQGFGIPTRFIMALGFQEIPLNRTEGLWIPVHTKCNGKRIIRDKIDYIYPIDIIHCLFIRMLMECEWTDWQFYYHMYWYIDTHMNVKLFCGEEASRNDMLNSSSTGRPLQIEQAPQTAGSRPTERAI